MIFIITLKTFAFVNYPLLYLCDLVFWKNIKILGLNLLFFAWLHCCHTLPGQLANDLRYDEQGIDIILQGSCIPHSVVKQLGMQ